MTDAVDEMVAKQAAKIKAEIEVRETASANLQDAIAEHQAELAILRGKLADIAGTAPIPPDVGSAIQELRDRPARKVIT